jgi:hypothetical protein
MFNEYKKINIQLHNGITPLGVYKPRKTVISHIFNEEYLLPWWLEHHKKIFDHGIIIDYASTDRSIEIIKEICPTWTVVPSINAEFDAILADKEVMEYEHNLGHGWRVALNVTEFLVGDYDKFFVNSSKPIQHLIPSIAFIDWDIEGSLDKTKPLWEQNKNMGVHYSHDFDFRKARSIHNYPNIYKTIGRHYTTYNNDEMILFHFGDLLSSPELLKRRLQIQHKIPQHQRQSQMGIQHWYGPNGTMDINSLHEWLSNRLNGRVTNCQNHKKDCWN